MKNATIPTVRHIPGRTAFLEEHVDPERPLLIKGLAKHWPANRRWSRESLRSDLHGNPDVKDRGVFFLSRKPVLEQDIQVPAFLQEILTSDQIMKDSVAWRFWINKKHNRTEFHFDTNAENVITVQVKGRKEWVLVSPNSPLPCYPFTNFALLRPEEKLLRNKDYYKFDLEEGDLLYVPPFWYHRAVAREEENININWTFTKKRTSVVSREFRREVERCELLDTFKHSKSSLVRSCYKKVIDALPKVGGIGWGLKSFIDSPYKPGRFAMVRRFFVELSKIPGTLMTLPAVRATLRKVDKT
ncbi:cupin-like domain-containing protein [Roseibium sp. M-1]